MAIDRASLESLRDLIEDVSLLLETSPDLPQNRTLGRVPEMAFVSRYRSCA
jgi:hypothetical protein